MKGNDHQDTTQAIATLSKPKGEAGDKKNGFNLREAMQLNDAAHKDLYDAIQVCELESSYEIVPFKFLYLFSVPFAPIPSERE